MNEMIIGRHPEGVAALAKFSADGADLLVSSNDEDVCVWDPAGGTLVARSQEVFNGINGLALCRRETLGPVVAVASEDTVSWVEALTGRRLDYPEAEDDTYWELAYARMPNGSNVLFGGVHGDPSRLMRWDVDSGEPLPSLSVADADAVTTVSVVAGPRGPIVFAGGGDTVRQWDPVRDVQCGPALIIPGDDMILHIVAAALPDGQTLLACSTQTSSYRWDATTGEMLGPPLEPLGHVEEILIDAGRPYLITADEDGMVRRRDARTGAPVDDLMAGTSPVTFGLAGVPMLAAAQPGGVIVARPLTPIP